MIDLLFYCVIEFKAQKPVTEVFLFQKIENIIFKGGHVTGEGVNLEECKINALSELKENGWTVTYSKVID